MSASAEPRYKEKYDVQMMVNQNWQTKMSFDLDQRQKALVQARKLMMQFPQIKVRVVFDAFNYLTKHHSQAIIYRSTRDPARLKLKSGSTRVRLGLWAYLSILANALLLSLASGLAMAAATHFMLGIFYVTLEMPVRQALLMAVFMGIFLGGLYMTVNYIRSRYSYEPPKWKRYFLWLLPASRPRLQAVCPISAMDAQVQSDMSSAAQAIAYMPVNDQQDRSVSPYEKMTPRELHRLFAAKGPKKKTSPSLGKEAQAFLQAVLRDSSIYMKTAGMKLRNRNRLGFALYYMGMAQTYFKSVRLSQKQQDKILAVLFISMGFKSEAYEQFLFDFEIYQDDPLDQDLIAKGSQAMVCFLSGDQKALRDVAYAVQEWKAEHQRAQEKQHCPYVMAVKFTLPVLDDVLQEGPAWPIEWAETLRPLSEALFYSEDDRVVMEFSKERACLEAAELMSQYLGKPTRVAMTLNTEDELLGEKALEMLAGIPDDVIVLSDKLYQDLSVKGEAVFSSIQLGDVNAHVFEGFDGTEPLQNSKKEVELLSFDHLSAFPD